MTENSDHQVIIAGKKIEKLEYKGQFVFTLKMIDEIHGKYDGIARKAFNRHKDKFIEGEDFFTVSYEEWSKINNVHITPARHKYRGNIYFFTKSGYLMLIKTFGDELAWKIQGDLINNYFQHKKNHNSDSITHCLDLF